jgi:hypothetical protein
MPLLTLTVTGRDIGMGYTPLFADGPAAVAGNPAGVQSAWNEQPSAKILFTHQEWIQDTRTEYLGFSAPIGENHSFALSVLTTTVSDIDIRLVPGPSQGTFTARDLAIGGTIAGRVSESVRAGITGRFLYQKILINEATGFSVDAGARVDLPVQGLEAAASIMNIGQMSVLDNERTSLPALFRAGVAYTTPVGSLTLSGRVDGMRNIPEKAWNVGAGAEAMFQNLVALRLGNEFGSDGRGFTAGLGISFGRFALDYGFAALRNDLGSTHTVSVGVVL